MGKNCVQFNERLVNCPMVSHKKKKGKNNETNRQTKNRKKTKQNEKI